MKQTNKSAALEKTPAVVGENDPVDRAGSTQRNALQAIAICFALCFVIQFIYLQTRNFDYVNYDDNVYVYENDHVRNGLTRSNIKWAFTATDAWNWHPLTWLSHMADIQRYGLEQPGKHHLTSVLIHAATAIVLLLALWRLTGSLLPSAFAVAVFAAHPLRVESVAWIAERKDVLSGFFFALTLLAYAGYVRRPSTFRYALTALAFVLGLMSKPMLVTVPFVLLLLDYWPLGRLVSKNSRPAGAPSFGWLLAEKAPLLLLAITASVMTVYAQDIAIQRIEKIPLSARAANAAVSYVVYIKQMFWPSGLVAIYKHPLDSLPWWQVIGSILILTGVTAGAIAARRRRPYLLVGWLWYVGMLVPVIGLVQVGEQARADRYTYLPQIGLVIALTWWVADLTASWKLQRPILFVAAICLIAALSVCARRQTGYWHDSFSLFNRALDCTEGDDIAHNGLGSALERAGKLQEAADQFCEALRIDPQSAKLYINLGTVLGKLGRHEEALLNFQKALAIDSTFKPAAELASGVALYHLGIAHYRSNRPREAIAELHAAVRSRPDDIAVLKAAAWMAATSEDSAVRSGSEAVEWSERAAKLSKDQDPVILDVLAAAYAEAGRFVEAKATAEKALDIAHARGVAQMEKKINAHLEIYRSGKPLREPPSDFDPTRAQ